MDFHSYYELPMISMVVSPPSSVHVTQDVGLQDPPRLRAQSRRRQRHRHDTRVAVAAAQAAKGGAATETAGGGAENTHRGWG